MTKEEGKLEYKSKLETPGLASEGQYPKTADASNELETHRWIKYACVKKLKD